MADKVTEVAGLGISMTNLQKLRAAATRKQTRQRDALTITEQEIEAYDQLIRNRIVAENKK